MAWDNTIVTMVRNLIGDVSITPTFSDDRIATAILVAVSIVGQEYDFDTTYIVDFDLLSLSPDPTETSTYDPVAVALFSLKAACLLNMNQYQSAVGTGIRVRDGDSEVDTTGSFAGYKDILALGPCGSYKSLLQSVYWSKRAGKGKALTSPSSSGGDTWGMPPYEVWSLREFFDGWAGW